LRPQAFPQALYVPFLPLCSHEPLLTSFVRRLQNIPNCTSHSLTSGRPTSDSDFSLSLSLSLVADHDVRENDGFKNVSLSNILSAKAAGEELTFIAPDEAKEYRAWEDKAFEVQVASHELLGHGSGKLFQERADGSRNFDEKTINPLTGKPITSWYRPGESYGSRIGPVSSSSASLFSSSLSTWSFGLSTLTLSSFPLAVEEMRAESVALYLATNKQILDIFGFKTQQQQDDLAYHMYLIMARAGVLALTFFDPATGKHGQAHMEARHGILRWLVQHGIASVDFVRDGDGRIVDAHAKVDREACLAKGKDVMGKLLLEIQVRCVALSLSRARRPSATEADLAARASQEEHGRRSRRDQVLQGAHQARPALGRRAAPACPRCVRALLAVALARRD